MLNTRWISSVVLAQVTQTPHFVADSMYHSLDPLKISVMLSYCLVSNFGEDYVAPSIVSVPPGATLTLEVDTFLMNITIPFYVLAAGSVSAIDPLANIPKSVVSSVAEVVTDLVFKAKLPFTASVVLIRIHGPMLKPELACAFPEIQGT